ncbi:MAG TPA: hypothetical protein VH684_15585 [Xanthobacteraceae bacterium]
MAYRFEPITPEKINAIVSIDVLRLAGGGQEHYFYADDSSPPSGIFYISGYPLIAGNAHMVAETSMLVSTPEFQDIVDKLEFHEYYQEWQKTRNTAFSIAGDVTRNPAYFRIVGMGRRALRSIFEHLKSETEYGEPDHWFVALWAITGGENPVPSEDQGKIRQMAHAWLEWGKREGYLNAESVGGSFPESR